MLKRLINKRLETFKERFPEYQTSKAGNIYFKKDPCFVERNMRYSGLSVTKGTYEKMGQDNKFKMSSCEAIFLIKPDTGKLLINRKNGKNYKLMTVKDVVFYPELAPLFFIGRKFEYLQHYPKLWKFPLAQNFGSLRELKSFLGFPFISDDDFYGVFKSDSYEHDYIFLFHLAKNKVNAYNLLRQHPSHDKIFHYLIDYVSLCDQCGVEPQIPGGFNKLKQLHDDLVYQINQEKLAVADKEIRYVIERPTTPAEGTFFLDVWRDMGLNFRKLESQYDMLLQGMKQSHCIGSNYSHQMDKQSFFTITYEGMEYDMQIYSGDIIYNHIGQFYGKRNCNPPQELKDMVRDPQISYAHRIVPIFKLGEMSKLKPLSIINPYNNRYVEVVGDDDPFF